MKILSFIRLENLERNFSEQKSLKRFFYSVLTKVDKGYDHQ